MKAVALINGPNLNLLGTREPEIYGTTTLSDIVLATKAEVEKGGLSFLSFQSNSEGELVDAIQRAAKDAAGIIINAGAYTHTSIAIRDALQASKLPVIEVHLSNIFKREEFRHHSMLSGVVNGMICGLGAKGYELAAHALLHLINK